MQKQNKIKINAKAKMLRKMSVKIFTTFCYVSCSVVILHRVIMSTRLDMTDLDVFSVLYTIYMFYVDLDVFYVLYTCSRWTWMCSMYCIHVLGGPGCALCTVYMF